MTASQRRPLCREWSLRANADPARPAIRACDQITTPPMVDHNPSSRAHVVTPVLLVACNGPHLRGHFWCLSCSPSFARFGIKGSFRTPFVALSPASMNRPSPITDRRFGRPAKRPLWFRFGGDPEAVSNKPVCTVVALLRDLCVPGFQSTTDQSSVVRLRLAFKAQFSAEFNSPRPATKM